MIWGNKMQQSDKFVVYFGHFELPDKNALAHRVRANSEMLKSLGYKVIYIGYSRSVEEKYCERSDDLFEIQYPTSILEWITDGKNYKFVEEIILNKGVEQCKAIIATGVGAGNSIGLIRLSKKYKIPYVADIVDWIIYDKRKSKLFYNIIKFSYEYILCSRLIQSGIKNRIYISSNLSQRFSNKKRNTIVIPSLTFRTDTRFLDLPIYRAESRIKMCYAGNPGRKGTKDRIDWCIAGFLHWADSDDVMDVYGVEKHIFESDFPEIKLDNRIVFHGICRNEECLSAIAKADFFVFAREDNEITRAGFPTKFSESMAIGTPVITTPTSDLKKYLHNNKNGFISQTCSQESYAESLREAFSTTAAERETMRVSSSLLDESLWRDQFGLFMERLV